MSQTSQTSQTVRTPSPAGPARTSATSRTRLLGRWLVLARVGWAAASAAIVALYAVSLPSYVTLRQASCAGVACAIAGAVTPERMSILHQWGLSLSAYSALVVALYVVRVLVGCAIGGLIAWRRSDDWMALAVAFALIATT